MHRLTTYQVGGPAEALWEARDIETLKKVIRYLKTESIPYAVLGGGSNLLVTDDGIDGVMILLKGSLATIEKEAQNPHIWAGGGVRLADLIRWCRLNGLSGPGISGRHSRNRRRRGGYECRRVRKSG